MRKKFTYSELDSKPIEIFLTSLESIKKGIKSNKKSVKLFEIEDDTARGFTASYNVTAKREDFKENLTDLMKTFEERELYEECAEILKALKSLKSN